MIYNSQHALLRTYRTHVACITLFIWRVLLAGALLAVVPHLTESSGVFTRHQTSRVAEVPSWAGPTLGSSAVELGISH